MFQPSDLTLVIAKKRFGQHFLTDPHKAEGLVDALDIARGDIVLEVGPGTGILTARILEKGAQLTAIELDRELLESLQNRFKLNNQFRLIQNDIIKFDPRTLGMNKFKLIGNLPYNISGAMVEWLIEYQELISLAVITVQKEVASRLKADINSRDYGSLTVLVQSFFDIRKLFDIPPGCFSPQPKVFSSALSLVPHSKLADDIDFDTFRVFVRACFAHKRKKLVNSLSSKGIKGFGIISREEIEKYLGILAKKNDIRAEQLNLNEFEELFRLVRDKRK